MRAMVLGQIGNITADPLAPRDLPVPEPGPGEVLVQVSVCGICRTDLHVIEGELEGPKLPLIPGHQAVGIISRVGSGVTTRRPGERVGLHQAILFQVAEDRVELRQSPTLPCRPA